MLVEEYVSPLCDNPCVPEDENKPCPKRIMELLVTQIGIIVIFII